MRLDDISVEMLKKALDLYVASAYQHAPLPLTVKSRVGFILEYSGDGLADLLAHDVVERIPSESEPQSPACYSIRLGNEKYPHMKLTLKRVGEEDWRFSIDCHDGVFEVENASPDKPRAQELKAYNQALRDRIESFWREADLPAEDEA